MSFDGVGKNKVIYYATIDPISLSAAYLRNENAEIQAGMFLKASLDNVFIVGDAGGDLRGKLRLMARDLYKGSKRGPRHAKLIEELLKPSTGRILKFHHKNMKCDEDIKKICEGAKLDAFVTTADRALNFGAIAVPIESYDACDFEEKRARQRATDFTLDQNASAVVVDSIKRLTRFSDTITIIDSYIGRSRGVERFLEGIQHVCRSWIQGVVTGVSPRFVNIYAAPSQNEDNILSTEELENAKKFNAEERRKLERKFLSPLAKEFSGTGIVFSLHFKKDPTGRKILHDRFLASKNGTLQFSRGFDLFDHNGGLLCQTMTIGRQVNHISRVCTLPQAMQPLIRRS